jgi:hypothetical protein
VIIQQAMWLYLRFTLSFRDVEDLLAERGVIVTYETVRRWVNHFGAKIAADPRKRLPIPHTTWRLTARTSTIDGSPRERWTKNHRSVFVSLGPPFTMRSKTITWSRSAAFSASRRRLDLNGEAKTDSTKRIRATIPTANSYSPPAQMKFSAHIGFAGSPKVLS